MYFKHNIPQNFTLVFRHQTLTCRSDIRYNLVQPSSFTDEENSSWEVEWLIQNHRMLAVILPEVFPPMWFILPLSHLFYRDIYFLRCLCKKSLFTNQSLSILSTFVSCRPLSQITWYLGIYINFLTHFSCLKLWPILKEINFLPPPPPKNEKINMMINDSSAVQNKDLVFVADTCLHKNNECAKWQAVSLFSCEEQNKIHFPCSNWGWWLYLYLYHKCMLHLYLQLKVGNGNG